MHQEASHVTVQLFSLNDIGANSRCTPQASLLRIALVTLGRYGGASNPFWRVGLWPKNMESVKNNVKTLPLEYL